ncbi:hypothetical protein HDU67_001852 [Dinochytrium kinnereticum]|nr:hypothetical protein HDU67_001852 [Dinochytrium kinnereticum]
MSSKAKKADPAVEKVDDEVKAPVEDDPNAFFEGQKKKKKKKKAFDFEEAAQEEAAAPEEKAAEPAPEAPVEEATEDAMFDFGEKKKKKKKAVKIADDENPADATPTPAEGEPAAAGGDGFDFGEKKKKKSKKRPDIAEFEAQLRAEGMMEDGATGQDLGASAADSGAGEGAGGEAWSGSARDYTYKELLTRVFQILRQNNPDLAGEKKRYTLVPPQVMREGTKKTMFANVVEISKRMRREPDHLIQYLFSELGTTGSIDGGQRLIIKGRFQQKQIENILKRYIVEYVTCKTCKSGDTLLTKENRLFFLQCQSCGSTKSVSAIKTGFMAQTQKRSAQRAAAGV